MTDSAVPPLAIDLDEILQGAAASFDALRGAQVFLTGGTGFFGRWLLECFVRANAQQSLGASITVLSRNPGAFIARAPHLINDAVRFHTGDVRDFSTPAGSFTHVIHAATDSCGAQKLHDRLHMVDTIVTGTRRVLDFARHCNVQRMLYVSSGAIYGRNPVAAVPVREDAAAGPLVTDSNIEYDESKRMAEALCALYHREYGLTVTIARSFALVGPHLPLDEHFAIGNFIHDALHGNSIAVHGDGSPVRSYLYAGDLARWLWTILTHGEPAHPYNVGSDEAVTIADLAHRVQAIVDPQVAVDILGAPATGPLNYQVPDITRAGAELRLRPAVLLDEAIARTARWHRQQVSAPPIVTPGPAPVSVVSASPHITSVNSILAMPDVIVFDFDGVMTDNRVLVFQDAREAVLCDRADGLGIAMLKKRGIPLLVLSTETNPVVAARCSKLGLECLQGIDAKEIALAAWLAHHGYDPARTIYLGNDINDLGCLKLVGCPVAVGDAYPQVKASAKLVLTRHGGHGAVRELADRVLAVTQG